MFSKQQFLTCFPTGVWVLDVEDTGALNTTIVSTLETLRSKQTWLPNQAVTDPAYSQQLQSFDDLHHMDAFEPFTTIALEAAKGVLDFLKYKYESCYITGCWANFSRSGEGHRSHVHPNNVLSGVYYAQAPEGCGELVFEDPRPQATVLVPDNEQQTPLNSHEFRVQPTTGMLVMFPSWLAHRVSVSKSREERISVAFNVMLRGKIGYAMASASV